MVLEDPLPRYPYSIKVIDFQQAVSAEISVEALHHYIDRVDEDGSNQPMPQQADGKVSERSCQSQHHGILQRGVFKGGI